MNSRAHLHIQRADVPARRRMGSHLAFPAGTFFYSNGGAAFAELPTGDWVFVNASGQLQQIRPTPLGAALVREKAHMVSESEFCHHLAVDAKMPE